MFSYTKGVKAQTHVFEKCQHCANKGFDCLHYSYTPPDPNTGKYPRINSEGKPEDIMMHACLHCTTYGLACSDVGRTIFVPEQGKFGVSGTDPCLAGG